MVLTQNVWLLVNNIYFKLMLLVFHEQHEYKELSKIKVQIY